MRPVNGIKTCTVRVQFLGGGLNYPQGRPVCLQTSYGRLISVNIAAAVQRQRSLSTGHRQIDIGEYFGIQKRAVQFTL